MTSETLQTLAPAVDPGDEVNAELREHLAFQRAEASRLRAVSRRLAHELALARRLLAGLLPEATGERPPSATTAVRLPAVEFASGSDALRFSVDDVHRSAVSTRLRGWSFAPALTDCAASITTLLFVPSGPDDGTSAVGGTYAAATEVQSRPDVAAAFAELSPAPARLDCAGFLATVFHASLTPGDYELFLHVEQPGVGAARQPTGVRLAF